MAEFRLMATQKNAQRVSCNSQNVRWDVGNKAVSCECSVLGDLSTDLAAERIGSVQWPIVQLRTSFWSRNRVSQCEMVAAHASSIHNMHMWCRQGICCKILLNLGHQNHTSVYQSRLKTANSTVCNFDARDTAAVATVCLWIGMPAHLLRACDMVIWE